MKTLLLAALLLASPGALAQVQVNQEPLTFDSPEQQERFNKLTEELRCLVCQNQNLADSDAPLAHDLRDEIHKMIQSGKGNDQIKAYLVERYGDFVLYRRRPTTRNGTGRRQPLECHGCPKKCPPARSISAAVGW